MKGNKTGNHSNDNRRNQQVTQNFFQCKQQALLLQGII